MVVHKPPGAAFDLDPCRFATGERVAILHQPARGLRPAPGRIIGTFSAIRR